MHKYIFKVGIPCPACIRPVRNLLLSCKDQITTGDMKVAVDVSTKTATVWLSDAKLSDDEVRKILRENVNYAYECQDVENHHGAVDSQDAGNHRLKGKLGVFLGAAFMGLCMSGLAIPMAVHHVLAILSTGLTFYLGKDIWNNAWQNLKNKLQGKETSLSMDLLLATSSILTLCISFASLVVPWVPPMFESALLILGCYHWGKAYRESEIGQADQGENFFSGQNDLVEVINPAGHKKIAELKPGDTIRIYTGQTIPADGLCLSQSAAVCKIIDTGVKNSAYPVKLHGNLESGWQVPQGQASIDIKVEKEAAKSALASKNKNYELLRQQKFEKRKKPLFEKGADLMLDYFVPCVLLIAFVTAIAVGTLFSPLSALQRLAYMAASACPCTLGLIIPLAINTAILILLEDGMRIKSDSLQFLSEVDTAIFDWNGTLTTGEPTVVSTNLKGPDLNYLAALEGQSNHPIAVSICEHINKQQTPPAEFKISDVKPHHSGLMAQIDENRYLTGNREYLDSLKINFSAYESKQRIEEQKNQLQAQYVTYFARAEPGQEFEILGHVILHDPLRKDAREVIRQLKEQGIKVGIWSGSDEASLANFAKQLNVDYYEANCLSSTQNSGQQKNKQDLMKKLCQQGRKTVMIGDSANDIFAMMESDYAIAVQSQNSHSLTLQIADAVLDPDHNPSKPLQPIVNAIITAKKTENSIKTNMAFNLLYNVVSVLLCGLGIFTSLALGAIMLAQSILVIWNVKRMVEQESGPCNDAIMSASPLSIYQGLGLSPLIPQPEPSKVTHLNAAPILTPIPVNLPQQTSITASRPLIGARP